MDDSETRRVRTGATGLAVVCALAGASVNCEEPMVLPTQTEALNVFVDRISMAQSDKLDLLLVIDNSTSMADKQEILLLAVPGLVNRLIDPICVDQETLGPSPTGETGEAGCLEGDEPQFQRLQDVHVGVITGSLGGHGGVLCTPELGSSDWNVTQNDRGRLVSRPGMDRAAATYGDLGFLAWSAPPLGCDPEAESDRASMVDNVQRLAVGIGQQGCGQQAMLEAWYRFLIDPEPPLEVAVDQTTGMAEAQGIDEVVLQQRAEFLRPDSMLAIFMITGGDDCSIKDEGNGHLVSDAREGAMPRSTSVCDIDPNDPCCLSCTQTDWPTGCSDPMDDQKCRQAPVHGDIDPTDDRLNLRCFDQERRFGQSFLYPIERYVSGLRDYEVPTRDGGTAPNPLYSESGVYPDVRPRLDYSLVFLGGIIGVPWQSIASDRSLTDPTLLEYLSASEMSQQGIWEVILGDPTASPPVLPTDPFMVQSVEPRNQRSDLASQSHPRTGMSITAPQPGPGGNPINGHEYTATNNDDLQYSCIFPLRAPKDCSDTDPGVGCDCRPSDESQDRPVCDGTTQLYAKAYPAPRILQTLKEYGANSIVASILPKSTDLPVSDPSFGYNPAVSALVPRFSDHRRGSCLPRELAVDPNTGEPLCKFVELTWPPCQPSCDTPGRAPPDPQVAASIEERMVELGMCGNEAPCDRYSMCEITHAQGDALQACQSEWEPVVEDGGYCYVDPVRVDPETGEPDPIGDPNLVADCPANQRRLLRFVGSTTNPIPWLNSTTFLHCQGLSYPQN